MNSSNKLIALGLGLLAAGNVAASLDHHNLSGTFFMSRMDSFINDEGPASASLATDGKFKPGFSLEYLGQVKPSLYVRLNGEYTKNESDNNDTIKSTKLSVQLVKGIDLSDATDLMIGAGANFLSLKADSGATTCPTGSCDEFPVSSGKYNALGASGLVSGKWYFTGNKRAGLFVGSSAEAAIYTGENKSELNFLGGGAGELKAQNTTFHTTADIALGYHSESHNNMHYTLKAGGRNSTRSGFFPASIFGLVSGSVDVFVDFGVSFS